MYNYLGIAYNLIAMQRRAYWNEKRLAEYRDRKIREIIRKAYDDVQFYHDMLNKAGVKPSDIKTSRDLNRLPVIRKNDLANGRDIISRRFNKEKLRIVSTSGSTGRPLSTFLSRKEDETRKAKHLRANIAVGQRPRDRWIVITAPQHFSDVTRLQRFFRIYAATPLSVFDDPKTQATVLEKLRPDVLDGYSSSLYLLATEIEKETIGFAPRFIIGGAELADGSSRRAIEHAFQVPFYDQYACIELERMAWQCKEKSGYHIDADSLVMQFVDEDGEEVAPGEGGEIVCTSLFNEAMPFIRYSVGDIGILSEEVNCPCGRTLPLMKVVEGRKDSIMVLPNHRKVAPLAIGWGMEFFRYFSDIEQYRVVQRRTDSFKILVKRKRGGLSDKEFGNELAAHFRGLLKLQENEATIEVEFVEDIPVESTGKLRKVISELNGHSNRS